MTRSVADQTYRGQAVARGWVVVSPAAPNGQLFFQGAEALVPELLDWIETWVTPESGRFHIVGGEQRRAQRVPGSGRTALIGRVAPRLPRLPAVRRRQSRTG